MTRKQRYVQCTMRRTVSSGSVRTTSFIPHQFAKTGGVLKLKNESDRWIDGWVVESVGEVVVEGDKVPDYRKSIRSHRQATGDSLPRR